MKHISDLDSRAVCEEGLGALWVIKRSVANTPPRGSNGEVATVVQVAGTVAVLGCFIDYLEKTIKFRLIQSYIIGWQKMIKLSFGTLSCCNTENRKKQVPFFCLMNKDHTSDTGFRASCVKIFSLFLKVLKAYENVTNKLTSTDVCFHLPTFTVTDNPLSPNRCSNFSSQILLLAVPQVSLNWMN